jgi:putative ABC transport system permease protein
VTALLERLLGRLPIGWLQLTHSKPRLAAALAGVAFAIVLVFMQLGFMNAMIRSIGLPYQALDADILILSSDANTLNDGSPVPRQRMFEALGVDGVASATPVFLGKIDWKQPDGTVRSLETFGVDPSVRTFRSPEIDARRADIQASDVALIDRGVRNVGKDVFPAIDAGQPLVFENRGRTLTAVSTFRIGGGFTADGYMVVSDQTFLKLFTNRSAGAPNLVLIRVEPGADAARVAERLRGVLPAYDSSARTISEAIAREQAYQLTQRPIGIVFGFGVVIGILVGVIIVYQVLSTDVADHLKEYATFKAIGYPQRFFLSIVFEEALILAILGFVPGLIASIGLYAAIVALTALPLQMTAGVAAAVFFGTLACCVVSGAFATRKLARANPADLF